MKRLLILSLSAIMLLNGSLFAQEKSTADLYKERKIENKAAKDAYTANVSKETKKQVKQFKKEGWKVAPGNMPMDKQIEEICIIKSTKDETGMKRYVTGGAESIGKTYDAAKMQALELAKVELAGNIATEISALTESTVGNEQMSQTDAESIASTVQVSKSLISQRLGRVEPVIELYRTTSTGSIQVNIVLAYNFKQALEVAKKVIKEKLEEKGQDLHKQLDALK